VLTGEAADISLALTLVRNFEAGDATTACRARCPLRIRVSMSPRGSLIVIAECSYQLDLTMPGMCPEEASSRNAMRDSLNFR
jgi:hypothetical protein